MNLHTCRFCGQWGDRESSLIKYATRHHAHLACLVAHGRHEEVLRHMPRWQLGNLRYFELEKFGLLGLVKGLMAEGSDAS